MRRTLSALTVLLVFAVVATACGDDGGGGDEDVAVANAVPVADRSRPSPDDDPALVADPMDTFGADLFTQMAASADGDENVVVSPASVMMALAMVEPGAVDQGQAQLRELLGIEDPDAFHAALNALDQSLESREPTDPGDGEPGDLLVRLANAAYLQEGYPFEEDFLDTIGRYYGPVLSEVDYTEDPDAVARQINDWVADNTEDRITDLIPEGTLTSDVVLTLVNALYLNASWFEPFEEGDTEDGPFTLTGGDEVTVPLMHGFSSGSAEGDGWVGASKDLTGGLAVQFVLPDDGRFDEVATDLPEVFRAVDEGPIGAELVLPRLETRFGASLADALKGLGLTAPFDDGEPGQLLGIADDPRLAISEVVHQTFVAMDEGGIEAAAATAVVFTATGAPIGDPVPVILDRPFFFRIVDQETGATLFLGRIMDPTA